MPNSINKKPAIVQLFDKYVDREYFKVKNGLFFSSEELVMTDRLKHEVVLTIDIGSGPDEVSMMFNGRPCKIIYTDISKIESFSEFLNEKNKK